MDEPLFDHIRRHCGSRDFIDRVNAFWTAFYHPKVWRDIGSPNPFDDEDISVAQFMKIQMAKSPHDKNRIEKFSH